MFAIFYPKRAPNLSEIEVYTEITEIHPAYGDFDFRIPHPQLHQNLKPVRKLLCTFFTYIEI